MDSGKTKTIIIRLRSLGKLRCVLLYHYQSTSLVTEKADQFQLRNRFQLLVTSPFLPYIERAHKETRETATCMKAELTARRRVGTGL